MASKFVVLACLQALAIQSALAQVILPQFLPNSIVESVPNCGCGQVLSLPQQIIQAPQQVLQLPQPVVQLPQQVVQLPQQVVQVPTTVVQDTSVSNNLANALQLLVVSNLLSNTLPFNEAEVIVPYGGLVEQVVSPYVSYAPQIASGCGCGGLGLPSCGCGGLGLPAVAPSCGCGGLGIFGF